VTIREDQDQDPHGDEGNDGDQPGSPRHAATTEPAPMHGARLRRRAPRAEEHPCMVGTLSGRRPIVARPVVGYDPGDARTIRPPSSAAQTIPKPLQPEQVER
jgi:hypothetical protein